MNIWKDTQRLPTQPDYSEFLRSLEQIFDLNGLATSTKNWEIDSDVHLKVVLTRACPRFYNRVLS